DAGIRVRDQVVQRLRDIDVAFVPRCDPLTEPQARAQDNVQPVGAQGSALARKRKVSLHDGSAFKCRRERCDEPVAAVSDSQAIRANNGHAMCASERLQATLHCPTFISDFGKSGGKHDECFYADVYALLDDRFHPLSCRADDDQFYWLADRSERWVAYLALDPS